MKAEVHNFSETFHSKTNQSYMSQTAEYFSRKILQYAGHLQAHFMSAG
jgi:hypothetical protein